MMTEALDPLNLPLWGSQLIEASAGTGKTWTIAALYLRLVLGHGDHGQRPSAALGPGQILVMTFTRAATRELSDRIRARLLQASRCFRGDEVPAGHDTFLQGLLAAYPDDAARSQAAYRLALAAEAMDEAAVHTIDAWCQRMLREHAFDSGNLFSEELVPDESELLKQAMQDVWRSEVYPLQGAALGALLTQWPSLEVMREQVEPLLREEGWLSEGSAREATPPSDTPLDGWLPGWVDERQATLTMLKMGWAERAVSMAAWLNEQRNAKRLNGRSYSAGSVEKWTQQIVAWATDPAQTDLVLQPETGRVRLTPAGLLEGQNKGQSLGEIPDAFAAFEALQQALQDLRPLAPQLLQHTARQVAQRLETLKRRSARFGFADLQRRLARALDSESGERLRQGILAQYPVALIDEFQDTSPLQYRLFDRLYQVKANDPRTTLLLIGDPKQSIYGFRGADIYSYLKVRRDTEGRHHMLGTNYRSTQALVDAVNTVFLQAEQRELGGAFCLAKTSALAMPFEPVRAQGRAEVLCEAGDQALAALNVYLHTEPLGSRDLLRTLADVGAEQMVRWLNDPAVGFRQGEHWRRLAPGDMAVLVRNRKEAQAIRSALQRRGVSSVYLSDQDSVFSSAQAKDLLRWLQAVADPLNTALARAAYATATVGLSLQALAEQVNDELVWDRRLAQLQRLQGVWQRHGVLTLVRQTLHELELPARWLNPAAAESAGTTAFAPAPVDGERRLTNWLHLGELLQAASVQFEGEQAQIRWLAEQIGSDHNRSEERIVRLESDAELVQVVTVHKSKGLEYPVVVMPFAASYREESRRGRSFIAWVNAEGERQLDFKRSQEALEAAETERLREDLRLLYVALTRARHMLWLGVGLPKGRSRQQGANELHKSALGYVLAGRSAVTVDEVLARLRGWAVGVDGQAQSVRVDITAPSSGTSKRPVTRLQREVVLPPLQEVPHYRARFDRRWAVGSFSALVRDLKPGWSDRDNDEDRDRGEGRELLGLGDGGVPQAEPGRPDSAPPEVLSRLSDPLREEQLREEWLAQAGWEVQAEGAPVAKALPEAAALDPSPWHTFPRGALAGNFLHEMMQWLAEEGFHRWGEAKLQTQLRRRCDRQGHGERWEVVQAWLQALLACPLPPLGGATLADVPTWLPEMEFWMPSTDLRSAALERVCRQHFWPGQPRPALVPRQLSGMLMGFADLVFEHEGRWWVLDYKSNVLGEQDADYHPAALQQTVLTHRYELQAALYLLALHRLLRVRLGEDYDPAQHLGGALCWFVRGVNGPTAGCVWLPVTPQGLHALEACLTADEEGRGTESRDSGNNSGDSSDRGARSEGMR